MSRWAYSQISPRVTAHLFTRLSLLHSSPVFVAVPNVSHMCLQTSWLLLGPLGLRAGIAGLLVALLCPPSTRCWDLWSSWYPMVFQVCAELSSPTGVILSSELCFEPHFPTYVTRPFLSLSPQVNTCKERLGGFSWDLKKSLFRLKIFSMGAQFRWRQNQQNACCLIISCEHHHFLRCLTCMIFSEEKEYPRQVFGFCSTDTATFLNFHFLLKESDNSKMREETRSGN